MDRTAGRIEQIHHDNGGFYTPCWIMSGRNPPPKNQQDANDTAQLD